MPAVAYCGDCKDLADERFSVVGVAARQVIASGGYMRTAAEVVAALNSSDLLKATRVVETVLDRGLEVPAPETMVGISNISQIVIQEEGVLLREQFGIGAGQQVPWAEALAAWKQPCPVETGVLIVEHDAARAEHSYRPAVALEPPPAAPGSEAAGTSSNSEAATNEGAALRAGLAVPALPLPGSMASRKGGEKQQQQGKRLRTPRTEQAHEAEAAARGKQHPQPSASGDSGGSESDSEPDALPCRYPCPAPGCAKVCLTARGLHHHQHAVHGDDDGEEQQQQQTAAAANVKWRTLSAVAASTAAAGSAHG